MPGALDRMIAVHSLHNAIEVTLRAIVLAHEIRAERELNIDFESLLNSIDQFQKFRDRDERLPYRQELRKLNTVRNMVQHHGHEPEAASMDEWRVFSKRFLDRALTQYFHLEFEDLSATHLVTDVRLRHLLETQATLMKKELWHQATCTGKLAFAYASVSLRTNLPSGESSWALFADSGNTRDLALGDLVRKIDQRFQNIEQYAIVLASGVTPGDYARYMRVPLHVQLAQGGSPFFERYRDQHPMAKEETEWVLEFVVESVIRWQNAGLAPTVAQWHQSGCDKFLEEQSA